MNVLIAEKDVNFNSILKFSNLTSTVPFEVNLARIGSLYGVNFIENRRTYRATYGHELNITRSVIWGLWKFNLITLCYAVCLEHLSSNFTYINTTIFIWSIMRFLHVNFLNIFLLNSLYWDPAELETTCLGVTSS